MSKYQIKRLSTNLYGDEYTDVRNFETAREMFSALNDLEEWHWGRGFHIFKHGEKIATSDRYQDLINAGITITIAALIDDPVPTPAQIKRRRKAAGLTQTQAAELIYKKLRTWQEWEAGDRAMDPALWELFQIKINASNG